MADQDPQSVKKRKSSDLSSISELDTSSNSPKTEVKQKKKKSRGASGKLVKPQTENGSSEQTDRDRQRYKNFYRHEQTTLRNQQKIFSTS